MADVIKLKEDGPQRHRFTTALERKTVRGSDYGPMQSDGFMYLCPQCGGYGGLPKSEICHICNGAGEIEPTDDRIVDYV